jgi:hypothetical protein
MCFDRFLHLDLLCVPLLLVEFGTETAQVLGILTGGVAFTGLSFAYPFFVIESEVKSQDWNAKMEKRKGKLPLAMLLLPPLDVFVLRLRCHCVNYSSSISDPDEPELTMAKIRDEHSKSGNKLVQVILAIEYASDFKFNVEILATRESFSLRSGSFRLW